VVPVTTPLPAPESLPVKDCCDSLVGDVCDCDEIWREFAAAMAEPIIWRAVR